MKDIEYSKHPRISECQIAQVAFEVIWEGTPFTRVLFSNSITPRINFPSKIRWCSLPLQRVLCQLVHHCDLLLCFFFESARVEDRKIIESPPGFPAAAPPLAAHCP